MIIEVIRLRTDPENVTALIEYDALAWNPELASHRAFLGKEVWSNADSPGEVALVIRWADASFREIPREKLERIRSRFEELFGKRYEPLGTVEYTRLVPEPQRGPDAS